MEAQEGKTDIKNTLEVVDLVIAVVDVGIEAEKDGKIDVKDLPLLMTLIPKLGPAFDDVDQIPKEFKDLDAGEADALVERIAVKLLVGKPEALEAAHAAMKAGVALFDLYKAVKALKDAKAV